MIRFRLKRKLRETKANRFTLRFEVKQRGLFRLFRFESKPPISDGKRQRNKANEAKRVGSTGRQQLTELHVLSSCPCYMFMLHLFAACDMSVLNVSDACYFSMLHMCATCTCYMSCVTCISCMSLLRFHAAFLCCMSI